jgi:hypothetical protein
MQTCCFIWDHLKKNNKLGGRTVSIKKISNKRLSRNLKTKNAPLRVLPLQTLRTRHRLKQITQELQTKQKTEEKKQTPIPPPPIQCSMDEVCHTNGKHVKRSLRKGPLTIRPFLRIRFGMTALRWVFVVLFIYLAAGTAIVMLQDGTESLKTIVIYSVIGFFTFFMGYLGWMLARDILEIALGKKTLSNEAEPDA